MAIKQVIDVDMPLIHDYDEATGELVLTVPLRSEPGQHREADQPPEYAQLRVSAAAQGFLEYQFGRLESEATVPPSRHRTPRQIQ
ncbi:hypothetical protein F0A17_13680 [Billgrantia pellis]|uniref:Uncharacterized protein n=1 Tax=Billgrantia pellis TaxID=2606936 RepID=A0A7V7FZ77_9GAMM|nr:hypothetical protein [Halomonas pellis]KAA0011172.1 hypothetical protein F0A17_13680 [Halomonas pellis]